MFKNEYIFYQIVQKTGILIITVLAVLTISIAVSPLAIAAPNENARNPDLEKIVFIHYYKPNHDSDIDCNPACEGNDGNTKFQLVNGGLKWPTLPIVYEINTNQFSPSEQTAIKNSAETWDEGLDFRSGSTIDLFVDSSTDKNQMDAGINDGHNIIVRGDLASNIIGQTSFWYNSATKEVLDADMVLNSDYTWTTDTIVGGITMDVQNIVTHELGHFLILNDLQSPKTSDLTMYAFGSNGEIKDRSLGLGDELGVVALYASSDGGDNGDDGGGKKCPPGKPDHPKCPKS